MPKSVVHLLEVVNVKHDEGNPGPPCQSVSQVRLKAPTIEYSQQPIALPGHELIGSLVNALYRGIDQLHPFLNPKVVLDEDVIVQENLAAVIVEICFRSPVRFIQGLSQRGNVW